MKMDELDIKLFGEVVRLFSVNLLKDMEEQPGTLIAFLMQKRTELISRSLDIDYQYLRTEEGKQTEYVRHRFETKILNLMELADSADRLLRGQGLLRDSPEKDIP